MLGQRQRPGQRQVPRCCPRHHTSDAASLISAPRASFYATATVAEGERRRAELEADCDRRTAEHNDYLRANYSHDVVTLIGSMAPNMGRGVNEEQDIIDTLLGSKIGALDALESTTTTLDFINVMRANNGMQPFAHLDSDSYSKTRALRNGGIKK